MRDNGFIVKYILLALVQVLLLSFVNFSQYLMVFILPVMVLCLPVRCGAVLSMFIAFTTGFVVDFVTGGILGLTSLALVPVAFLRIPTLKLSFGQELFTRGDNISIRKAGAGKMLIDILIVSMVFITLYVWADGAGTRPFWFNALKIALSLIASSLVSLIVAFILCPDPNSKWM